MVKATVAPGTRKDGRAARDAVHEARGAIRAAIDTAPLARRRAAERERHRAMDAGRVALSALRAAFSIGRQIVPVGLFSTLITSP